MAAYQAFTSSRLAEPDSIQLVALLRENVDPTVGVQHQQGTAYYVLKKTNSDPWTEGQITLAQTVLDTAPDASNQRTVEHRIDAYPPEILAMLLVLLDQINVLRARAGLTQVTPAQALQAIKDKLISVVALRQ